MYQQKAPNPYAALNQRYTSARFNLLIMLGFTLINVILMAIGSNTYLLFSATIPYAAVQTGMFLCGKLPAEWYEGGTFEFLPDFVLFIAIAIAAAIIIYIFMCWLFSSKGRYGFFIAALVYFALDTLYLLWIFDSTLILDLVFHAWVIGYLVIGIVSGVKLKKTPAPAPEVATGDCTFTDVSDSTDEGNGNKE